MSRRARGDHGAVAVLVAIIAAILFVLAGLVVDLGLGRDTRRQSQNAADASALAAANVLWPTNGDCALVNPSGSLSAPCFSDAIKAAKDYAGENFGVTAAAWSTCADPYSFWTPTGGSPCISFTDDTLNAAVAPARPTKVRVLTPIRNVPTGFGTLAGVSRIGIGSVARATFTLAVTQPCGLCVVGPGTHDFQNGDAVITSADIYINGNSAVSNNGLVSSTGHIYVEGTASGSLSDYTPDPTTGVPAITDPLDGVQLPSPANSWYGLAAKTNPCIQGPGIYAGWSVSNSTCTLTPGVYVVASGIVDLSGNNAGNLLGAGVTIYLSCGSGTTPHPCATSGEAGARLDATGNGQLQISAPTSGPLKGIAIAADRHDIDGSGAGHDVISLNGNALAGLSGAVYTLAGTVQMTGNGCVSTTSMLVTGDLSFSGNNACLKLTYNELDAPDPEPRNLRLDQ